MTCPACSRALREVSAGAVIVDVCDGGCGGIWFDAGELRHVDESHEPVEPSLLDIRRDAALVVDHDATRDCPRCASVVLKRRFTSVTRRVAVDECPGCAGIWLDAGELAQLRSEYPTAQARAEAAGEHLDAAFGEWIEAERRSGQRDRKAAEDLRDKFRTLGAAGGGVDSGALESIGFLLVL